MPHTTPRRQGRTRAEQLADEIGDRIRDEPLAAGAPLGTIESLRAETGFAYATVSEAVRLLRDRGVLEVRPGRGGGLFVADSGPLVRLRHTLLTAADQPTRVADAIELRDQLEELIALGAARCRTADDVADLQGHLGRMAAADTWDGFLRANWSLHERIAAICPNVMARAVYVGTLGPLRDRTSRIDSAAGATAADAAAYRADRLDVHRSLVAAIAAGDEAEVRRTVRLHNRTTDISHPTET